MAESLSVVFDYHIGGESGKLYGKRLVVSRMVVAAGECMVEEALEREFRIGNRYGLHGRASARLVETARLFEADVRLIRNGETVDCKSILDVLTLACTQGTPVTIRIQGRDARAAMAALEQLVENRFDEE